MLTTRATLIEQTFNWNARNVFAVLLWRLKCGFCFFDDYLNFKLLFLQYSKKTLLD